MATKRAKAAEALDPLQYARRLQHLIAELCVEAMSFTARSKAEETVHQWLGRADLDPDDATSVNAVAEAFLLALELATFAPSFSGATAIDRLARQRRFVEIAGLVFLNPGTDQVSADVVALRQPMKRLPSQKFLRDLALKLNAMCAVLGHGLPSSESPTWGSIAKLIHVRIQGLTPQLSQSCT